jgi:hypothetical protein
MRIICMHKSTPAMEQGAPPSPELLAGLGPLMEEMMKAGVFIAGEGLRPSKHGVRLKFSGGKRTIVKGPFPGSNALIDRYLIVRVKSIDEAIDWASRFAGPDSELDVRPVTEPWDLGFVPKPADGTPVRFMILHRSDANAEAGVRPAPQRLAAMEKLTDDLGAAGVLLSSEALQPSSKGVRVKFYDGKRTIIDGPFTESKELIAGFSIMQVDSIDDAIEWSARFAQLIGDLEIDVRLLREP